MFQPKNAVWLLLALVTSWSSAQTFPSIAEVDLLFPKNDTYAPTVLMPMVFAIQNAPAADPLSLALKWVLYYPADAEHLTIIRNDAIPKTYLSASPNGTYYEFTSLYNLTTLEGPWKLVWTLTSENCTQFPVSNSSEFGYDQVNSVIFTTKNDAQAADLLAATADDVCASAGSFTFNVTGEETVTIREGPGVTTCAVVASMSPTPTPNPCVARLDVTMASSISAELTATAYGFPTPLVSCPAKSAGSLEGRLHVGGLNWLVLTFSCFYILPIWMIGSRQQVFFRVLVNKTGFTSKVVD